MLTEAAPTIPIPSDIDRALAGGHSLNAVLMDALLQHRHDLFRIENGVIRGLVKPIGSARNELRQVLSALGGPYLQDLSGMPASALKQLEREIATTVAQMEMAVTTKMRAGLSSVARAEIAAQDKLLQGAIPKAAGWKPWSPTNAEIAGLVNTPYHGSVWGDRIGRGAAEAELKLRASAHAARATGASGDALMRRFDSVLGQDYQARVVGLLRTEAGRVANDALLGSYRRNSQTVKTVRVVETLDDLTCLVCASRDGMVLQPDADPTQFPPYHANCRGFTAPVVESWQDMGLKAADLMPRERAAMDGRVPSVVTYPTWFAKQSGAFQLKYLGPARFQLYSSGKLELKSMVKDFRILSLAELPGAKKAGGAAAKAAGTVTAPNAAPVAPSAHQPTYAQVGKAIQQEVPDTAQQLLDKKAMELHQVLTRSRAAGEKLGSWSPETSAAVKRIQAEMSALRKTVKAERATLPLPAAVKPLDAELKAALVRDAKDRGTLTIGGVPPSQIRKTAEASVEAVNSMVHRKYTQGGVNAVFEQIDGRANCGGVMGIRLAAGDDVGTAVHELGHFIEQRDMRVRKAAWEFLEERTRGEKAVGLRKLTGGNFEATEVAKEDKFFNPYVGKVYGEPKVVYGMTIYPDTEVISMGLEAMYRDPARFFREDRGHFELILKLMRGEL